MGKHNLGWGNLKDKSSWKEDRMQDGDEGRDRSCEVKDDGASQGEQMWKAEAQEEKRCTGLQVEVPWRRELSLCSDRGSSKTNDLVQLRIGHLRLAYI